MSGDWRDALQNKLETSKLVCDAPLKGATTLRIGGPAQALLELECEEDLQTVVSFALKHELPWHLLGKGSNLLIRDEGLKGIVLRLGKAFQHTRIDLSTNQVQVGAGLANASFVEKCRARGLGGMEFLVAIPGAIGGAIAMNAGAHGGETAQFLKSVRLFDARGGIQDKPAEAFEFSYRHSPLRGQDGYVILGGTFALLTLDDEAIQARKAEIQKYRRETQPRDFPNCGSVFKNPPENHAARLIEETGLKGRRLGGAQVSEKHANFIVNRGGATSDDVLKLIETVQERVHGQTGIRLELEMQIL